MKALHWLLVLLPLTGVGQVQPKRPVLLGVELTKPVLAATGGWPLFRRAVLIEPTIKVPLTDGQTLTIQPGYSNVTTRTVFRNINQQFRGAYLKVGMEHSVGKQLSAGWQGLVSVYQHAGTFTFPGATFGDYVGLLPARPKATFGFEPHVDGIVAVADRFELRAVGRLGVGATLGYHSTDPPAVYIPGLGLGTGRTFFISAGLGVQLLYRTR